MRTDLQLIQGAIADFNFTDINQDQGYILSCQFLRIYSIHLPAKFKGLPTIWYFAIFPQGDESKALKNKNEIIIEAKRIIFTYTTEKKLPLVVISDDIRFNTANELRDDDKAVFFLNKDKIPGKLSAHVPVKTTAIILAAKTALEKKKENYPLHLSPYLPNKPVEGWKFFGRQKALSKILQTSANCFVIGARKMGKSSLLQEAERQLKADGFGVYKIGVQYLQSFNAVVNAIVTQLSFKDAYYASREAAVVDTNFILSVIKRLRSQDKRKIVLVFDELGNVMRKDPRNAWNFFGVLRDLSHNGEIRVLASAFQEVYIRTHNDPESPLINFGTIVDINLFSRTEVEELLVDPLSIWYEVDNKNELIQFVRRKFGFHPLILQYVGEYIFRNIFYSSDKRIATYLHKILEDDIDEFKQAFTEIYELNHSLLERYIFAKSCQGALENGKELSAIEIKQRTLEEILLNFDIPSELDERNYFLKRLSLKGLIYQDESNGLIFKIATPILYYYLEAHNDVQELLLNYETEIPKLFKNIKITYQDEGS
jgi:hypothetical protein